MKNELPTKPLKTTQAAQAARQGSFMNKAQPIFDPSTHYRIKVQGRLDAGWLQNFDDLAEIGVYEAGQMEESTVLEVHTDQSGIIGLVRRLHGLGITIVRFQIVTSESEASEG